MGRTLTIRKRRRRTACAWRLLDGSIAVTNADIPRFVDATGYVTLAERPANPDDYPGAKPELLVPSSVVFKKASGPVDMRNHYNWWAYVARRRLAPPARPGELAQGL